MSDVEEYLKCWEDGVRDPLVGEGLESYEGALLHEVWTPRWKKFQPPMWKIFRWAYKIKRILFTRCYPVAVSTSGETISQNPNGSYSLEIQCNKFESPIIDAKAKELIESIGGNKDE